MVPRNWPGGPRGLLPQGSRGSANLKSGGYFRPVHQLGRKHVDAKVPKGFGRAGVVEVMSDFDGDTYRTVYTVKFAGAVYALHAFQKKSKKGIKTPPVELDIVRKRLKAAEEHHAKSRAEENQGRGSSHH